MAYQDEVLADSPWGYWPLDDTGVSTTAVDASGNARDGTYVNANTKEQPALLPGDSLGPSVNMSAAGGYVSVPAADLSAGDWTVEMIVRQQFNWSSQRTLFTAHQSAATGRSLRIYQTGTGVFGRIVVDFFNEADQTADGVCFPLWPAHIVIRRSDADDQTTVWVDGVLVGTFTVGPLLAAPSTVRFGANSAGSVQWVSFAQHLAIYLSALPAARIEAHAKAARARAITIDEPTDVPDCALWLRAESLAALADGAEIAQWDDESGEGNHATQAGARKPYYFEDVHLGRAAVRFMDLANPGGVGGKFLNIPRFLEGMSAGEAFIVLMIDGPSVIQDTGLWIFSNPGQAGQFPISSADPRIIESWGTGTAKVIGGAPGELAKTVRVYNVYSAASDWKAFLDGVEIATTTSNTVSFARSGATPYFLGCSTNATDNNSLYLKGYVFAVVAFERKLDAAERTQVTAWLQREYQEPPPPPPQPPTQPGAFTQQPGAALDQIPFLFRWGESTDPNEPPVGFTYRLERTSNDGASWLIQAAALADREYLFNPLGVPTGIYRLRVRAENIFGASEWTESDDFTVVHASAAIARRRGIFLGASGGNGLLRADQGIDDGGTVFRTFLRTAPIAPAGFGGEIVLYGISFKIRYAGSAFFRVTPLINGVRKPPQFLTFSGAGAYVERTVELAFLEHISNVRSGYRCQWFRLEIEMSPLDPHAVLYGFAAEIERVREGMPDATPAPEEIQEFLMPARRGVFAGAGGSLARLDEGTDDLGQEYALRVGTHDYMPAGPGGEAIYPYIYLPILHANPTTIPLELVCAVEGVPLPAIAVAVPAADGLVVDVLEVRLSQLHTIGGFATRHAARGERIRILSLRNTDPLDSTRWALHGWEPEFETVRRTEAVHTPIGGPDFYQPGSASGGSGGSTSDGEIGPDWPGIETGPGPDDPIGEAVFEDEEFSTWTPPENGGEDDEIEFFSPWQPGTCEGTEQLIEMEMSLYSPHWLVNGGPPPGGAPTYNLKFGVETETGGKGEGGLAGGTAFSGDGFEVLAFFCFDEGDVSCVSGGSSTWNTPESGLPFNFGTPTRWAWYRWSVPCGVAWRIFIRFELSSTAPGDSPEYGFDVERFSRTVS